MVLYKPPRHRNNRLRPTDRPTPLPLIISFSSTLDTQTSTTSEDADFNPMDYFYELPEGCIANALSFTTPADACRLSSVSSIFKSAAESDAVWECFLPPDYRSLIPSSSFSSKKKLYLSLCDYPILIDDGRKSFSLDKRTGKKCYMLSARDLMIVWGDTPMYWRWISFPGSRFPEVAELVSVCWLEIRGRISTRILSPNTTYTAYLVFKLTDASFGFEFQPVETSVGLVGSGETQKRTVYLDMERVSRRLRQQQQQQLGHRIPRHIRPINFRNRYMAAEDPRKAGATNLSKREDGWLETELGDFYHGGGGGDNSELEMSFMEVKHGNWKGGIIVQGIEIRPK